MPYVEKLKLVHIAIPKTGTTSMVRALKDLCELHGGEVSLVKDAIDRDFRKQFGLDALGDKKPGHAKHLSAAQLQLILGEKYHQSFSFSIVRNPWARAVSRCFFTHVDNKPSFIERWRRGTGRTFHRKTFDDWIRARAVEAEKKGGLSNQIDKLVDLQGKIIVNYVGRLESVNESFAHVCRSIGVDPIPVPHVNPSQKSKKRYTDYYDDWSRDLIRDLYKRDIEAFGYEFEK